MSGEAGRALPQRRGGIAVFEQQSEQITGRRLMTIFSVRHITSYRYVREVEFGEH
ncbi:transglutaminase family protein, partial [Rhizobium ruizarguesonis]